MLSHFRCFEIHFPFLHANCCGLHVFPSQTALDSSSPSKQSLSASHRNELGIHSPLTLHLNLSNGHGLLVVDRIFCFVVSFTVAGMAVVVVALVATQQIWLRM